MVSLPSWLRHESRDVVAITLRRWYDGPWTWLHNSLQDGAMRSARILKRPRRAFRVAWVLMALVTLAGCNSDAMLPVAPNVLQDGSGSAQLQQLPADQHRPEMQILYLTDRAPEQTGNGRITYGFKRSR